MTGRHCLVAQSPRRRPLPAKSESGPTAAEREGPRGTHENARDLPRSSSSRAERAASPALPMQTFDAARQKVRQILRDGARRPRGSRAIQARHLLFAADRAFPVFASLDGALCSLSPMGFHPIRRGHDSGSAYGRCTRDRLRRPLRRDTASVAPERATAI